MCTVLVTQGILNHPCQMVSGIHQASQAPAVFNNHPVTDFCGQFEW